MADGDTEGEDLLHLELDGLLDVVDLVGHRVVVGEETRELAGLVQARAQDTWDLLDERLRCQKCIERGGELLDKLFVLVKLLQVLDRLVRNAFLLANINVLGIGNDADLHVWSWDERELDGACNGVTSYHFRRARVSVARRPHRTEGSQVQPPCFRIRSRE